MYAKRLAGAILTLALIAMATPLSHAQTPSAQLPAGFFPPAWESPAKTPLTNFLSQHGTVSDWLPPGDYRSLVDVLAAMEKLQRLNTPLPSGITLRLDAPSPIPIKSPPSDLQNLPLPAPKPAPDALQFSTVLFESETLQIIESIREDPSAPPKLKTVRTLSLIDKTTGEEIYSEEHIPGQLLAGCRGTTCRTFERALAGNAVLPQSDGLRVTRKVADDVYMIESADPDARPEAMMADPALASFLRAEGNYLEPNGILRLLSTIPNDPDFGNLWGLHNTGQDLPGWGVPKGDGITDINAPEVWDIWKGDRNILVCVIDTGINYALPDLAPNIWTNPNEIPGNNIDDDGNGFVDDVHGYDFINEDGDPMDDHSHGTHVAGTIGAVGDNGIGITGVMWKTQIMALKFIGVFGGTLEDAVRAIDYATGMGCSLTSNSWGGGPFEQALYDAIARARDSDSLFVAAAGNDGNDADVSPMYPAAYDLPNIISVAAIDAEGKLASFSNWGKVSVDIGAPGVQVLSYIKDGNLAWSAGTSMATPHVSGVVGLLRSVNPAVPYTVVKNVLLDTVTAMPSLEGKTVTGGRPDAIAALRVLTTNVYPVLTLPVIPNDGYLSPGETVDIPLKLINIGSDVSPGVEAVLTASDSKVIIQTPLLAYGDLQPLVPVSRTATIEIDPDIVTPATIIFTLSITDTASNSSIRTFEEPIYTMGLISGNITNERYGTAIEGVTISYDGVITDTQPPVALGGAVLSDSLGEYQFSLPEGTYTLTVIKTDFLDAEPVIVTTPPDQILDFTLGAPEIGVSPLRLSFTVPPDQTASQPFTISDDQGTTLLKYTVSVLSGGFDQILRITNDDLEEYRVASGIAWDDRNKRLWITTFAPYTTAHIHQIDPTTGRTLRMLPVKNPACPVSDENRRVLFQATWDGERLWALELMQADENGCYGSFPEWAVIKIDADTGNILQRIPLGEVASYDRGDQFFGLTWKDGMLITRYDKGRISVWDPFDIRIMRIDPLSGEVVKGPNLAGPDYFRCVADRSSYCTAPKALSFNGQVLWGARILDTNGNRVWDKHNISQMVLEDDLTLRILEDIDVSSLYPQDGCYRRTVDTSWDGLFLWALDTAANTSSSCNNLRHMDLLNFGARSWIRVSPIVGSIPYGETGDITVTVDATGMAIGTYEGDVVVKANDLDEPITLVHVTMIVSESPPPANTLCLQSTLQHRTRRAMTHELSSARLTVTDTVTGTVAKEASLPLNEQGEARLTDTSGIEEGKPYDLTLKPRGHLALAITNVTDPFISCHAMGEAKHGDYNETGRIDLSDLITAINYHVQRVDSPHREKFEDIYRNVFGLADIVEIIRNYVQTR